MSGHWRTRSRPGRAHAATRLHLYLLTARDTPRHRIPSGRPSNRTDRSAPRRSQGAISSSAPQPSSSAFGPAPTHCGLLLSSTHSEREGRTADRRPQPELRRGGSRPAPGYSWGHEGCGLIRGRGSPPGASPPPARPAASWRPRVLRSAWSWWAASRRRSEGLFWGWASHRRVR